MAAPDDAEAREVVPLNDREAADVAEAWAYFERLRPRGGVEVPGKRARRALGVWVTTVYPLLWRHGYDPDTLEVWRTEAEGTLQPRARPDSSALGWSRHQWEVYDDELRQRFVSDPLLGGK